jgi:hypothetical protein
MLIRGFLKIELQIQKSGPIDNGYKRFIPAAYSSYGAAFSMALLLSKPLNHSSLFSFFKSFRQSHLSITSLDVRLQNHSGRLPLLIFLESEILVSEVLVNHSAVSLNHL